MTHVLSLGAINKQTGKYVYPKIANKKDEYVCPECNKDLILCQGEKVRPYFRHKVDSVNPCHHYSNPTETQIHKDGKMLMKSLLERKIQGISGKKKQELINLIQQSDTAHVSTPIKSILGISENVKMTISEVEIARPRTNVEPVIILDKGGNHWYQKNKTDIPECVKILEIHKDGNNYYYTIQMRNKSEKQTLGQYLFHWKTPPLYSLLPDENRERIHRAYDYGDIQGQIKGEVIGYEKGFNKGFNKGFDTGFEKGQNISEK